MIYVRRLLILILFIVVGVDLDASARILRSARGRGRLESSRQRSLAVRQNLIDEQPQSDGEDAASAIAIFHAFDWSFKEVFEYLDDIQRAGYSHIQVSPIQGHRTTLPHTYEKDLKSALVAKFGSEDLIPPGYIEDGVVVKDAHGDDARTPWWLPYQPTSYELDSKYGTERDFRQLVDSAKLRGLGIIVDVVFNHTAAVDGGEKQEWIDALNERSQVGDDAPKYKKLLEGLLTVHKDFNRPEHFNEFKMFKAPYFYWNSDSSRLERNESIATALDLSGIWMSSALPSLNLSHPHVQAVQE